MQTFRAEQFTQRGRSVHVFQSQSARVERHTHDFIEIAYILSGKGTETVDGNSYEVRHGDIVFINYGSTHSYRVTDQKGFSNLDCLFLPEFLDPSLEEKSVGGQRRGVQGFLYREVL